ncbi:hypothetical protein EEL33_08755 [Muribaculaceae bacterium Isolate-037 (Harlan)]|nr:hypothetical protein EEL33_08755 [Muribaculaceae bacterium Isolate-037 (Harlan)]
MTTRVRMAIMSHLSDAQQMMKYDAELANLHINFAKALLIKYDNIDADVTYSELNDLWTKEVANN